MDNTRPDDMYAKGGVVTREGFGNHSVVDTNSRPYEVALNDRVWCTRCWTTDTLAQYWSGQHRERCTPRPNPYRQLLDQISAPPPSET